MFVLAKWPAVLRVILRGMARTVILTRRTCNRLITLATGHIGILSRTPLITFLPILNVVSTCIPPSMRKPQPNKVRFKPFILTKVMPAKWLRPKAPSKKLNKHLILQLHFSPFSVLKHEKLSWTAVSLIPIVLSSLADEICPPLVPRKKCKQWRQTGNSSVAVPGTLPADTPPFSSLLPTLQSTAPA